MSGFERSAPIPGSQGPRRSELKRINNAPPPMSSWRLEVLEAKKQAAEAMRKANGGGEKSRSRSRSQKKHGGTSGAGGSSSSRSKKKHDEAQTLAGKDKLLMQAKRGGEGWYAAVAQASDKWEEDERRRKLALEKAAVADQGKKPKERDKEREKDRDRDQRKDRETEKGGAESMLGVRTRKEEEKAILREQERQRKAQEEAERKWKLEFEARENQLAADRQKAEDERKKKEQMEKSRKAKLGHAFAMDDSDGEGAVPQPAAKKASRQMQSLAIKPVGVPAPALPPDTTEVLPSAAVGPDGVPKASGASSEMGKNLGFNDCSDAAEAFMRLQERKRKGRSTAFGGPPRGCSPWRDGKAKR